MMMKPNENVGDFDVAKKNKKARNVFLSTMLDKETHLLSRSIRFFSSDMLLFRSHFHHDSSRNSSALVRKVDLINSFKIYVTHFFHSLEKRHFRLKLIDFLWVCTSHNRYWLLWAVVSHPEVIKMNRRIKRRKSPLWELIAMVDEPNCIPDY